MKRYKDSIGACVIIVFALAYYYASFKINILENKLINSTFFPRVLAGALILLSILLIIKDIRRQSQSNPESGDRMERAAVIRILLTVLCLITYVALLETVGFLLMTVLYIFAQILILTPKEQMSVKRLLWFVAISILFSLAVYVVFTRLFTMVLPRGILNF